MALEFRRVWLIRVGGGVIFILDTGTDFLERTRAIGDENRDRRSFALLSSASLFSLSRLDRGYDDYA